MDRKGQVWIETVLYTIVGLAIIGIVLGFAMPKINESRDNVIISQSIDALKNLDSKITDISRNPGSVGKIEFNLKRGKLFISAKDDRIYLIIDGLESIYSSENATINDGRVKIISKAENKKNSINLSLEYNFNITFNGEDNDKIIDAASTSYNIFAANNQSNIDLRIN